MAIEVVTIQLPGSPGPAGAPARLTIGSVTTGAVNSAPAVSLTGAGPDYVLNFTLPAGIQGPIGPTGPQGDPGPAGPAGTDGKDGAGIQIAGQVATYSALPTTLTSADAGKAYVVTADGKLYIWSGTAFPANGSGQSFVGPAGPANTLTIGTVTTGAAGTSASASITGTAPNQTLSLTIPRGDAGTAGANGAIGPAGPANSLAIGTVTTGASGSAASASITGTAPNQTLNLTIPQGPTGATGAAGTNGQGVPTGGTTGQVLQKRSATNYDTTWVTPTATSSPTIETLPAGSTITVIKGTGGWPARPTARTDIIIAWKGPDPSPTIVSSGTGGMLNNVDYRLVTP